MQVPETGGKFYKAALSLYNDHCRALGKCVLFLSCSDMRTRAVVRHAQAPTFEQAFAACRSEMEQTLKRKMITPKVVRVDMVLRERALSFGELVKKIEQTRRNYFRSGITLDANYMLAFTEQELNANAMLYPGGANSMGAVNRGRFEKYAALRFPETKPVVPTDETPVVVFETCGLFGDEQGRIVPLIESGLNGGLSAGRRELPMTAANVYELVNTASRHLERQVKKSGEFIYGTFPCFNALIPTYNSLRHISSTYSMLEAWEVCPSMGLKQAIDRSIAFALNELIKVHELPDGSQAAFILDRASDEYRLGANGVSLLMFAKYAELTGSTEHHALMALLANGIRFMQDAQTGEFVHVLNPDLSVKEPFRIVYYDGEAVFGLLRLYKLTRDPQLLTASLTAFDSFIAREHWKHHDHWLSYSVNEITLYHPEEKYFRFGIQNFNGHLDFILTRDTTYPTLLELMMAAERMVCRLHTMPKQAHLLGEFDENKFYSALKHRAEYLLNGYFWPEFAMYFQSPETVAGSFFIRHHSFRVRIDDVEHYLSGFVAYWKWLTQQKSVAQTSCGACPADEPSNKSSDESGNELQERNLTDSPGTMLNAECLVNLTGGQWIREPGPDWACAGFCIWDEQFRAGSMVFARGKRKAWYSDAAFIQNNAQCLAGVVCENPGDYDGPLPTLLVDDFTRITRALAGHMRSLYQGRVIAVTGSCGKTTTTAMLAHMLGAYGQVVWSQISRNLIGGVMAYLASMPQEADFWVLEVAGGPAQAASAVAGPHVAIVTALAEAHLDYFKTLEGVAKVKSRIFEGMQPGGHAIINRDIEFYDMFVSEAQKKSLIITSFGLHEQADMRLLEQNHGLVRFRWNGVEHTLRVSTPGQHSAMNALSCLIAGEALGLSFEAMAPAFGTFKALAGRGRILHPPRMKLTVYDEAYNANPGSMRATLRSFADETPEGARKVLILGDMLELGEHTQQLHVGLVADILAVNPDCVLLVGPLMREVWRELAPQCTGSWYPDVQVLLNDMDLWIRSHDHILVKASNGIQFGKVVKALAEK